MYWVDCVVYVNDIESVVVQLLYIGRVDRIVRVIFGTAEYILFKMQWFVIIMNADRTGMFKDSSGMYVVDERKYMRGVRVTDELFMLVNLKVEQVFLSDIFNAVSRMLVIGVNIRGRNMVYDAEGDDYAV